MAGQYRQRGQACWLTQESARLRLFASGFLWSILMFGQATALDFAPAQEQVRSSARHSVNPRE